MIMMMHFSLVLYYVQRNRVLMSNDVIWGLIWWGEELNEIIEVGGVEKWVINKWGEGGSKFMIRRWEKDSLKWMDQFPESQKSEDHFCWNLETRKEDSKKKAKKP